jgi:hypothetical protein
VRISIWRLTRSLLASLVLPMLLALCIDMAFGTMPFAIAMAGLVSIPLAAFFVSRAALSEIDRVAQLVAPEEAFDDC